MDEGGVGMGVWGCPMYAHMCMHIYTCTYACTCMLNMINMINMDDSRSVANCNYYTYIYVCVHVHACVHMHASVCMWGHSPMPLDYPRHPPPTCSLPRDAGSPKHQNSISPELIEVIPFCLKILYL